MNKAILMSSLILVINLMAIDKVVVNKIEWSKLHTNEKDFIIYEGNNKNPYTGIVFENYSSGKKKVQFNLKNGKYDGLNTGWYENGQVRTRENYKNGEYTGIQTYWYESGVKENEEHYEGNILVLSTEWYEDGTKRFEEHYKGNLDGLSIQWDSYGQKIKEEYYREKEIIEKKKWYEINEMNNEVSIEWYKKGQNK